MCSGEEREENCDEDDSMVVKISSRNQPDLDLMEYYNDWRGSEESNPPPPPPPPLPPAVDDLHSCVGTFGEDLPQSKSFRSLSVRSIRCEIFFFIFR